MKRNRKSILAKKVNYYGKDRKMSPYGLIYGFDRDSSYFRETRFRKELRRIGKKRFRAQYKRELFSAIEDHISESMYDPYELDYDIISADMVYDRIMNREVEEDLFEDFGYSLYDYDSDFDYFLDA